MEKKIHGLSLLHQKALYKLGRLNITQSIAIDTDKDSMANLTWLKEWAVQAEISEVSDDNTAVTYYVAGYIGRCISQNESAIHAKVL